MRDNLAQTLMEDFADVTGVTGKTKPRRYLWTDAFAVCNFLGLARDTGDKRYLGFAKELIRQVHHVLGRHRDDDPRQGWISGLPEEEGEQHPTCGGLRIGKEHNERKPYQEADPDLEWDQDGQYFHYLTKWMHALGRMGQETGENRYLQWAAELAATAYKSFSCQTSPRDSKRLVWKMSIDLSRPLVSSMGQHDPLDGLITCLELQTNKTISPEQDAELTLAIIDLTEMCEATHWATDDPLGIGGLLDNATRLAQLVFEHHVEHRELLFQILIAAEQNLRAFPSITLRYPARHRLAFRELGLSLGIHGLQRISKLVSKDRELATVNNRLLLYQPLAEKIEACWSDSAYRVSSTWMNHRDINTVMLATSLAPDSYLHI